MRIWFKWSIDGETGEVVGVYCYDINTVAFHVAEMKGVSENVAREFVICFIKFLDRNITLWELAWLTIWSDVFTELMKTVRIEYVTK